MRKTFLAVLFLAVAASAADFTFERSKLSTGQWATKNPAQKKSLGGTISDLFPTNGYRMEIHGKDAEITFKTPLTPAEVSSLSNLVTSYQIEIPPAQRMTNWQASKANFNKIGLWEARFLMRLGQLNTILLDEGLITVALTPETATPREVATYVIQATHPQASNIGIALEKCDEWVESFTVEFIGNPPDGSTVRSQIQTP